MALGCEVPGGEAVVKNWYPPEIIIFDSSIQVSNDFDVWFLSSNYHGFQVNNFDVTIIIFVYHGF